VRIEAMKIDSADSHLSIDDYIGIPFEEANCYELVRLAHPDELPQIQCSADASANVFRIFVSTTSEWFLPVKDLRVNDIIAMAQLPEHPDIIQHFGLYVGNGKMLQTLKNVGSHLMSIDDPRVKSTIRGYYRWSKS
jgi:hypothetical protein